MSIDSRPATDPAAEWGDWPDIEPWAGRLMEAVARQHPSQHGAVFVPDPSVEGLRLVAQVLGPHDDAPRVLDTVDRVVPIDGSVCGRVYRTGVGALVPDASLDPDDRTFPDGATRSSVTVPVGPPADVVAVIDVAAPWVSAFTVADFDRLTELAAAAYATFPRRQVA